MPKRVERSVRVGVVRVTEISTGSGEEFQIEIKSRHAGAKQTSFTIYLDEYENLVDAISGLVPSDTFVPF